MMKELRSQISTNLINNCHLAYVEQSSFWHSSPVQPFLHLHAQHSKSFSADLIAHLPLSLQLVASVQASLDEQQVCDDNDRPCKELVIADRGNKTFDDEGRIISRSGGESKPVIYHIYKPSYPSLRDALTDSSPACTVFLPVSHSSEPFCASLRPVMVTAFQGCSPARSIHGRESARALRQESS